MLLLVQKDLDEKQKNEVIDLISQIKIKDSVKMPFLLESYTKMIKYNLDMMKLHFEYTVNGLGYEDAKKDFILKVSFNKNE